MSEYVIGCADCAPRTSDWQLMMREDDMVNSVSSERPTPVQLSVADAARLVLEPTAAQIPDLRALLAKGCFVKVRTGCSLRELICEQFQISPEYLKNDIKVLFLNFSPVNEVDTVFVKDGAILALSGALPGVVGAAMRRDGLSSMRSSITYKESVDERVVRGEGVIHVKLFNLVLADLGESFLKRGVYESSAVLAEFLGRFPIDFWRECKITRNGQVVREGSLFDDLSADDRWTSFSIR
ncbi:MAG: hypothetical protein A2V77_07320 [Anaeromyxobacter sp. RBG_16_69_14]|nr:MAG: hypothetical protein A2V77_07320 [Anaeromyxobacter sp. RBG_16_69_14]